MSGTDSSDCSDSDARSRDLMTDESTIVEIVVENLRSRMKSLITVATACIRIAFNEEERKKFIEDYEIHLKAAIINELVFVKGNQASEELAKQSMIRASKTNFAALNGNPESIAADMASIEDDTMAAVEDYKSKITEEEIQAHPMFKKLTENINEILAAAAAQSSQEPNDEDSVEEDLVGEEYIPTIDPISKGPLKKPVKNSICGHVYCKSALRKLLKSSKAYFRCPYVGCSNREIIQRHHLIKDAALIAKIREKIAREKQAARQAASSTSYEEGTNRHGITHFLELPMNN